MGNNKLNFYRISLKDGTNVTQDKKAKSLGISISDYHKAFNLKGK